MGSSQTTKLELQWGRKLEQKHHRVKKKVEEKDYP
jgi:hypothetical protein